MEKFSLSAPHIFIQARMGSARLPGKVLRDAGGKPMLGYLVERLERGVPDMPVAVATSDGTEDDPVAEFCAGLDLPCVRGPLNDVAGRFLKAVDRFGADAFVRISGDSPLLDTQLIEHAVALFDDKDADLATNVLERTFPKGMSVEVVRAEAFRRAYSNMQSPDEFEHVTSHFYRTPTDWRIADFTSGRDLGRVNLSVDTASDFARFENILGRMTSPHWTYGMNAVLELAGIDSRVPA